MSNRPLAAKSWGLVELEVCTLQHFDIAAPRLRLLDPGSMDSEAPSTCDHHLRHLGLEQRGESERDSAQALRGKQVDCAGGIRWTGSAARGPRPVEGCWRTPRTHDIPRIRGWLCVCGVRRRSSLSGSASGDDRLRPMRRGGVRNLVHPALRKELPAKLSKSRAPPSARPRHRTRIVLPSPPTTSFYAAANGSQDSCSAPGWSAAAPAFQRRLRTQNSACTECSARAAAERRARTTSRAFAAGVACAAFDGSQAAALPPLKQWFWARYRARRAESRASKAGASQRASCEAPQACARPSAEAAASNANPARAPQPAHDPLLRRCKRFAAFRTCAAHHNGAGQRRRSRGDCARRIRRAKSAARALLPNAARTTSRAFAAGVACAAFDGSQAGALSPVERAETIGTEQGAGRRARNLVHPERGALRRELPAKLSKPPYTERRRSGIERDSLALVLPSPPTTVFYAAATDSQDLCSAAQWSGAARLFRGGLRQQDSARTRGDSSAGSRARTTSAHSRTALRVRLAARALSPLDERERAGSGKRLGAGRGTSCNKRDPERRARRLEAPKLGQVDARGAPRQCASNESTPLVLPTAARRAPPNRPSAAFPRERTHPARRFSAVPSPRSSRRC